MQSGRRSEADSSSPPASTGLGYQACMVGLRGWPRRSCDALPTATPPKGLSWSVRFSQLRRPATLLPIIAAMCSAWVPGTVLGSPDRENEPSLPARPWPHRASVLPLYYVTPSHSKGQICASPDRDRGTSMCASATGQLAPGLEREAAQQRVGERAGGQGAHADRRGGGDRGARRRGNPVAQRHRPRERQHRPTAGDGLLAQRAVGVDHRRVTDGLEHRQVGDRVGVGVAVLEGVALARGELADRLRPCPRRSSRTRPRRCTCRPRRPSGSPSRGWRPARGRWARRSPRPTPRRRRRRGRTACGRRSGRRPRRRPAGRRCRAASRRRSTLTCSTSQPAHMLVMYDAHPVHLVVVGARHQEEELRVAGLQNGPAVDQPLIEERFAESQRAGLGDDGLVEVEERRGAERGGPVPACGGRSARPRPPDRVTVTPISIGRAPCDRSRPIVPKWQFTPRVCDCCIFPARLNVCFQRQGYLRLAALSRVYSEHYSAYAGCASARPPGADTRRPPPPPPWRGSSLFSGRISSTRISAGKLRCVAGSRLRAPSVPAVCPQIGVHPQIAPCVTGAPMSGPPHGGMSEHQRAGILAGPRRPDAELRDELDRVVAARRLLRWCGRDAPLSRKAWSAAVGGPARRGVPPGGAVARRCRGAAT